MCQPKFHSRSPGQPGTLREWQGRLSPRDESVNRKKGFEAIVSK